MEGFYLQKFSLCLGKWLFVQGEIVEVIFYRAIDMSVCVKQKRLKHGCRVHHCGSSLKDVDSPSDFSITAKFLLFTTSSAIFFLCTNIRWRHVLAALFGANLQQKKKKKEKKCFWDGVLWKGKKPKTNIYCGKKHWIQEISLIKKLDSVQDPNCGSLRKSAKGRKEILLQLESRLNLAGEYIG